MSEKGKKAGHHARRPARPVTPSGKVEQDAAHDAVIARLAGDVLAHLRAQIEHDSGMVNDRVPQNGDQFKSREVLTQANQLKLQDRPLAVVQTTMRDDLRELEAVVVDNAVNVGRLNGILGNVSTEFYRAEPGAAPSDSPADSRAFLRQQIDRLRETNRGLERMIAVAEAQL